jgi:hypothetical protein
MLTRPILSRFLWRPQLFIRLAPLPTGRAISSVSSFSAAFPTSHSDWKCAHGYDSSPLGAPEDINISRFLSDRPQVLDEDRGLEQLGVPLPRFGGVCMITPVRRRLPCLVNTLPAGPGGSSWMD